MPIYEFICKDCSKNFEELVMSASRIGEVICPACGSGQVKKKMSTFASKAAADGGSSFSFNNSSASSCTTST
jgi:putative FmdB family regulatory protein